MKQLIAAILVIAVCVAGIIGWAINLAGCIKLAVGGSAITALFVIKIIGIAVAPLGAILGLFF